MGVGLGMARQTGLLNLYLLPPRRICEGWQAIWCWGGVFEGKEDCHFFSFFFTTYDGDFFLFFSFLFGLVWCLYDGSMLLGCAYVTAAYKSNGTGIGVTL